ncbi:hypothetical protein DH2020_046111 [Rehmannia glutinosa]|uniref:Beta-glucosidase n=1 Tax=Rehmannia glutinosa TaxID=99300 RepID=A0ABR0UDE3_REHGL
MARLCSIVVPPKFLLLLHLATAVIGVDHYTRADFPADFVFGSGTAAPQYEGAAFEDGRTPSIWDTFAHSGRYQINGRHRSGGLQNLYIVVKTHSQKDFAEYADVCFKEFGDRVLHWTTLNEVNVAALGGYDEGTIALGHCSKRSVCAKGDSTTEPYTATQNGKVGLNIYAVGFIPYTNSTQDVMATQRVQDFYIGWVINPLIFGDYPDIVKKRAKTRIPAFTKQESEQIKGSLDFIGVNHYFTVFVKDDPSTKRDIKDFYADLAAELICQMTRRNGTLNDTSRVEYVQAYIGSVLDAVRNGSNTKGYFVWTFLDCLELLDGYGTSFGLYYVDLDDKELKRYQKLSARWYSNFLKGKKGTMPNAITRGPNSDWVIFPREGKKLAVGRSVRS